jgi:DNA-binding LytR/AlgR family response regulator
MTAPPSLFGTPREWAIDLAVAAALGVFLGILGPFGSYDGAGVEIRIAYWVGNMVIGFVVMATTVRLSLRVAQRVDIPVWFAVALGVAIGAAPLTLLISAYSALVWPPFRGRWPQPLALYGQILAIAEPFAFAYYLLGDRGWRRALDRTTPATRTPAELEPPAARTSETTDFLDRLPARLGRDLLCLQMEDHYVRAHTTLGSDLILIPLKQAVAELEMRIEGLQVHRSWWVARDAVAQSVFQGRNLTLRLTNGLEAPVSRAMVARLREAGWIE